MIKITKLLLEDSFNDFLSTNEDVVTDTLNRVKSVNKKLQDEFIQDRNWEANRIEMELKRLKYDKDVYTTVYSWLVTPHGSFDISSDFLRIRIKGDYGKAIEAINLACDYAEGKKDSKQIDARYRRWYNRK